MGIRVALVDDHSQFRAQLAAVLARQGGVAIAFQACDGVAAEAALREMTAVERPDVMLLDVDMPRGGGIGAARRMHTLYPDLRIVALSLHDDPGLVAAMKDAGAQAYVLKGQPLGELLAAIRGSAN